MQRGVCGASVVFAHNIPAKCDDSGWIVGNPEVSRIGNDKSALRQDAGLSSYALFHGRLSFLNFAEAAFWPAWQLSGSTFDLSVIRTAMHQRLALR
jgi:hypothetical protein